jgi:hypothetical protein
MTSDLIASLLFFVLPGLATIACAKRIVAYNARYHPRLYGRVGRMLVLLAPYVGGIWWIVLRL